MRQDSSTGPERGPSSCSRQAPATGRQAPRSATGAPRQRPAAHEVFGSFLSTLERLDRDATRQARKTVGAS
ncbi:MAG: hypothetical protein ACRC56_00775 [Bosea sp. (in: a-proteobacteria)]